MRRRPAPAFLRPVPIEPSQTLVAELRAHLPHRSCWQRLPAFCQFKLWNPTLSTRRTGFPPSITRMLGEAPWIGKARLSPHGKERDFGLNATDEISNSTWKCQD
jgi:hypothetical protein